MRFICKLSEKSDTHVMNICIRIVVFPNRTVQCNAADAVTWVPDCASGMLKLADSQCAAWVPDFTRCTLTTERNTYSEYTFFKVPQPFTLTM